jgi:hypothetical protein
MNEKKIILGLIIFLFCGCVFLSYTEKNQQFSLSKDNRWETYFNNPKNNNLQFIIKNNGRGGIFSWQVKSNGDVLESGREKIPPGELRIISPQNISTEAKEKISLEITDEKNNRQEIYKNF